MLSDSISYGLCTLPGEISSRRKESDKTKEGRGNCILMPAHSLQWKTVWHIASFTDAIRKQKKLTLAPIQPFLQPLAKDLRLFPRVLKGRERHGVAADGHILMLARAGWLSGPAQHDTLVTRVCTLSDTPLASVYFSRFWDCSLHTWHWKAWKLSGRLGGHPRWALDQQCQQEEKNMCAQGDFLTIYQIGGIVYFPHISQRVHLWAPFTTSNRQVGRDMAVKIRRWLINGLAIGFNTQIYNYLYFFS